METQENAADAPETQEEFVVGGPDQRYDTEYVMSLLRHRYPFLMIDRIKYVEPRYIVAIKNVTINEPFFQGHFPGHPIMPGVMIIEALAQAGSLMLSNRERKERLVYLAGVDRARFKKPVLPGDVLELRVRSLQERRRLGKAECEAWVGEDMVASAEMTFAYAD